MAARVEASRSVGSEIRASVKRTVSAALLLALMFALPSAASHRRSHGNTVEDDVPDDHLPALLGQLGLAACVRQLMNGMIGLYIVTK
jgi:hypothetical protein